MRAHAIEFSELPTEEAEAADPLLTQQHMEVGRSGWRMNLAWALGKYCSVQVLRGRRHAPRHDNGDLLDWGEQTKRQRNQKSFTYAVLAGRQSDLEVFRYLYQVCERQIQQAARKYSETNISRYDHLEVYPDRSDMADFRASAVHGLSTKLQAMQQRGQESDAKGTALVRNRYREARAAMPAGGTFKSSARRYHCQAGYEAGRKVSLNAGVKGSSRSAIPRTRRLGGE